GRRRLPGGRHSAVRRGPQRASLKEGGRRRTEASNEREATPSCTHSPCQPQPECCAAFPYRGQNIPPPSWFPGICLILVNVPRRNRALSAAHGALPPW